MHEKNNDFEWKNGNFAVKNTKNKEKTIHNMIVILKNVK